MEWSKYNHVYLSSKHGYLLFNALSGAFLDINDDKLRKVIMDIKENVAEYDFSTKDKLKNLLLSTAIISEQDEENMYIPIYFSLLSRFNKNNRLLTILPTLNCNLACTYCYAETNLRNDKMSEKVINQIKQYVKKEYKDVDHVNIQWYGGEPLLAFDVIKDISCFFNDLKVSYSASIVTNATLLSQNKIELLEELKINNIQVTIDGCKATHDKKRIFKNRQGTFDIIINNLRLLSKHLDIIGRDKIKVDIRVNVDQECRDDYHQIQQFISENFPDFDVYPGIIVQYSTCNSAIPCFANRREIASFYIEQYEKYGITNLQFYPFNKGLYNCMAESPYSDMVGPNGEMYLCLKDVGDKREEVGSIFDERRNVSLLSKYCTGYLTFYDRKCSRCHVLGLCGGGCANIKYRNKKYNEKNDPCPPYRDYLILEKYLDIHYEILKQKEKHE
jgi:uncharacterized protein